MPFSVLAQSPPSSTVSLSAAWVPVVNRGPNCSMKNPRNNAFRLQALPSMVMRSHVTCTVPLRTGTALCPGSPHRRRPHLSQPSGELWRCHRVCVQVPLILIPNSPEHKRRDAGHPGMPRGLPTRKVIGKEQHRQAGSLGGPGSHGALDTCLRTGGWRQVLADDPSNNV